MKKPLLVLAVLLFSACSALPAAPGRPTPAPLPVPETSTSGPTATSAATEPASAVTLEPAQTPLPTLQPGQPVALTSLDMVDAAIGWGIESAGHILRTRDGGLTWQNVTPPQGASNGAGFFALDARTAWAKSCDDGTGLCSLLRTTDGGKTWQVHVTQLPPELSYAFMTFENLDYGLAKTYDVGAGQADISVYKTSDGGATWKQIVLTNQPGNPDSVPGAIHICNICGDVFYYSPRGLVTVSGDLASDPGGAVHLSISTDLGKTWHDQALPLPARKFADGSVAPIQPVFFNDGYGVLPFRIVKRTPDYSTLVYDVTAVYTTHDDGRTWHPNSTVLENGASVAFITPQDAFAF